MHPTSGADQPAAEAGHAALPTETTFTARRPVIRTPVAVSKSVQAATSLRANPTAPLALSLYPSAPISSANRWVTGAPPMMTFT
jgi:hypothetical protein